MKNGKYENEKMNKKQNKKSKGYMHLLFVY